MPPATETRAEFLVRIHDSFPEFIKALWDDRRLHKIAPINWVELDMCQYAATVGFGGVLACRGLGKTHLITAALTCYRLYRDCNRKILIPSKSHGHAKKIVSILRQWITLVPFLQHLQPIAGNGPDSVTQFQVGPARESLQPSVTAIGIDGQLEGNRAHSIFPDDVETKGNTETPESREDLDERVKEFKDILYPEVPGAEERAKDPVEIVYVGTYHHEESLYLKLGRDLKRGYKFRTYPIVYPQPDEDVMNLAPKLAAKLSSGEARPGDLVFPWRFDEANVIGKRAEGPHRFAMQHALLASLAEGDRYPLKLADLIVMDVPRAEAPVRVEYGQRRGTESTAIQGIRLLGVNSKDKLYEPFLLDKVSAPYTGTKGGLDPAGRGSDRTGLSIVSHLAGNLFVKCCLGLKGGADTEALDLIARTLRDHDCRDLYLETNIDAFGTYQTLLEAAIRRHFLEPNVNPMFPRGWKCSVTAEHATGQKELRIVGTLEPIISAHRLIVDRRVVEYEDGEPLDNQFQYQLARITRQRKCLDEDGKLDSLEKAVRAWNTSLGGNQSVAAERTRLQIQEDALRKAGILVKPRQSPRFFDLPTI